MEWPARVTSRRLRATLQAIAELPEAMLYLGLARLQEAEFLYETNLFPEREYTFTGVYSRNGGGHCMPASS